MSKKKKEIVKLLCSECAREMAMPLNCPNCANLVCERCASRHVCPRMSPADMMEPITRLSKDLREAAKSLSVVEIRYLVDLYYQIQDFRKASGNQITSMTKSGEPTLVLAWSYNSMETIEKEIKKWLDIYTDAEPTGMGRWAKGITGIGPIIAAGLLAHIDINKAPTVGHIWRFAGYDPTAKWEKGQKRPHNADLKVLCWKIGESFVKVSSNAKDFYGKYYIARKAYEQGKNERGEYAEQAAKELQTKRYRTTTEAYKAYKEGKLPDGHIHARAKRYAVKLFLSHWHGEAYRRILGKEPPMPYPIGREAPEGSKHIHTHFIEPPMQKESAKSNEEPIMPESATDAEEPKY